MTPEGQHNASYRLLRYSLFPLFLITVCPPAAIIMWYTNVALNGSLTALAVLFTQKGFFTTLYQIWSPVFFGTREAWFIISIFMITQLLLMRIVPGKRFEGPITPKGNVPVYKANGVLCFGITLTLFYLCAYQFRWFPPTIVYDHFGDILGALNIFSLIFCFILYFKGRFAPSASDHSLSGNFIFDYYWDRTISPHSWMGYQNVHQLPFRNDGVADYYLVICCKTKSIVWIKQFDVSCAIDSVSLYREIFLVGERLFAFIGYHARSSRFLYLLGMFSVGPEHLYFSSLIFS